MITVTGAPSTRSKPDGIVQGLSPLWRGISDMSLPELSWQDALDTDASMRLRVAEKTALPAEAVPTTRKRWLPIHFKRSDANNAVRILLGADGLVLGRQTAARYEPGSLLKLGGHQRFGGSVAYPYAGGELPTTLCNKAVNPTIVLLSGVDYVRYDDAIVFRRASDPFALGLHMRREDGDDVVTLLAADDVSAGGTTQELQALLGLPASSLDMDCALAAELWRALVRGPTAHDIAGLIAMAHGMRVADSDEVVEHVYAADSGTVVITDVAEYRLSPGVVSSLQRGDRLSRGDVIGDGLHMVSTHEPAFAPRLAELTDTLFLPGTFFKNPAAAVGFKFTTSRITASESDTVLRFEVLGTDDAVAAFWAGTSADVASLLAGHLNDRFVKTARAGSVTPLSEFIRNVLGSLLIVVKDAGIAMPKSSIAAMRQIRTLLPAYTALISLTRHAADEGSIGLASTELATSYPGWYLQEQTLHRTSECVLSHISRQTGVLGYRRYQQKRTA